MSKPHDDEQKPPADGPLTRLTKERERHRHPAPQPLLQPSRPTHGRDDYAEGTPEHDDDREA
jgi:hypothetical protein